MLSELVDREAELALLQGCYLRPDLLDRDGLAECFALPSHAAAYQAMAELHGRGLTPDLVTLKDQAPDIDIAILAKLSEGVSVANIGHYARKLRELALRRGILRALEGLGEAAQDQASDVAEVLDGAMAELVRLEAAGRTGETVTSEQAMRETLAEIERRHRERSAGTLGVPTGLERLDRVLDGLRPGALYLLGARPSVGKTALALQIADHAAVRHGLPVAVVSLEMPIPELQLRLLASRTGISLNWLQRGEVEGQQWSKVLEVAAMIAGAPLRYYTRRGATVADIRTWARQQTRRGARLLVIDYLGLIRHPAASMSLYQQVSQTSAALKTLALELNIPLIVNVQLSRAASDTRPTLAHLRDSGSLEQDADVVILLHRTEAEGETVPVELDIAKNRNGPCSRIRLRFNREAMLFAEEVVT